MKFDPSYDGPVQGFQLWINLKSANKLDPPEFQTRAPTRCRWSTWLLVFGAKVLLGELSGQASPVETQGIRCQYVDYELDANAEATHPRPNGMSTLFATWPRAPARFVVPRSKEGRENLPAILRDARARGPQRKKATCASKASSRLGFMTPRWRFQRSPSSNTAPSSCRRKTRSCRPSRTTTRALPCRRVHVQAPHEGSTVTTTKSTSRGDGDAGQCRYEVDKTILGIISAFSVRRLPLVDLAEGPI